MKYVLALLALAGLIVSVLALRVHTMDPKLAPPCAVDEHWDCGTVNHSKYAVFPPTSDEVDLITGATKPGSHSIPVATVGIIGYAVMLALALAGRFTLVRELALIGFMAAAFLTYLEAYVIQKWCIYCVWSQCIIAALLAAATLATYLNHRSSTKLRPIEEHRNVA